MADPLGSIEKQLTNPGQSAPPPLDNWFPPLSGDIDIVIRADGEWLHEGTTFKRKAIVELFSSILRRESDGDYYLVTPVEKWRIRVEKHALQVIDIARDPTSSVLIATCNHGPTLKIGPEHPLKACDDSDVPWLQCNHGLTAGLTRSVWYRLVHSAETREGALVVRSGEWAFSLGKVKSE
ncbi:MAG: DUF1285 domain-containing protein [Chromatocurvus sp.]